MTTEKIRFTANDYLVLMHSDGEKYTEENRYDEPEDYEYFDTEAEAAEWVKARIAQLTEENDLYHITETRRGLDSIEYHALMIERDVFDPEYDEWEIDESFESEHSTDTLPDEVRAAAEASQRSYWKYLDYEDNGEGYHGIAYYLDK